MTETAMIFTGQGSQVAARHQAGASRAMLLPLRMPACGPLLAPAKSSLEKALAGIEIQVLERTVPHAVDLTVYDAAAEIRAAPGS
ncbi:MAG: hypothetical protein ACPGJE_05655 [Wenzhouxiangellaceae bacterium]